MIHLLVKSLELMERDYQRVMLIQSKSKFMIQGNTGFLMGFEKNG